MSALPSGPFREVVIRDPLHRRCIGRFIEQAAARVLSRETMRCVCLDCIPNQIELEAWHMYWARIDHDSGDEDRG